MFILQETPIDIIQTKKYATAMTGAFVSFEGLVRADQNKGSNVSILQYIADTPVCVEEGNKIISEALSLFSLSNAVCIQRFGKLNVGETAVWIGVWSAHRDEAFKGCRYIIEEIKKRLLIWKKEFYTDGQSIWVRGQETPTIG